MLFPYMLCSGGGGGRGGRGGIADTTGILLVLYNWHIAGTTGID
jgi:hypothetical protein